MLGAEGKGVRPLVRKTCDATISIPLHADIESLNVSVAAALVLYEARAGQRSIGHQSCPSRRLYLFDGSNLLHAGGFADRAPARRRARELRRPAWRAWRRSCSTGTARTRRSAGSSVRFAPHADDLLERLAAEQRAGESVLIVTSDNAVRVTTGQEVRKRALGLVPRRARRDRARRTAAEPARRSGRRRDARGTGAAAPGPAARAESNGNHCPDVRPVVVAATLTRSEVACTPGVPPAFPRTPTKETAMAQEKARPTRARTKKDVVA